MQKPAKQVHSPVGLVMPSLDGIQRDFRIVSDAHEAMRVAKMLHSAGIYQACSDHLDQNIEWSLSKWADSLYPTPSSMDPSIGVDLQEGSLFVAVDFMEYSQHLVGSSLEHLEKETPGLGQFILKVVDRSPLFVFTPNAAYEACKEYIWGGEEDERAYIEGYGVEQEYKDEVFKKSDFFQHIPEWAVNWNQDLTLADFPSIAGSWIHKLLAEIEELEKGVYHRDQVIEYSCLPATQMWWHKEDSMSMIVDEMYRCMCDNGYETYLSPLFKLVDSPDCIPVLSWYLKYAKAIDELIKGLSNESFFASMEDV